jgi:hypothetical protein
MRANASRHIRGYHVARQLCGARSYCAIALVPFKRCVDKWTACRTLETLTTWYRLNRASAWYSMMGYDPIVSDVWTATRYQWIRWATRDAPWWNTSHKSIPSNHNVAMSYTSTWYISSMWTAWIDATYRNVYWDMPTMWIAWIDATYRETLWPYRQHVSIHHIVRHSGDMAIWQYGNMAIWQYVLIHSDHVNGLDWHNILWCARWYEPHWLTLYIMTHATRWIPWIDTLYCATLWLHRQYMVICSDHVSSMDWHSYAQYVMMRATVWTSWIDTTYRETYPLRRWHESTQHVAIHTD